MSWNNKPAINYRSDAVLYLNHSHEYRMVDVDKAVRKALAEGKRKYPGISAATVRKSLRFHASGLKTEPGADADRFQKDAGAVIVNCAR